MQRKLFYMGVLNETVLEIKYTDLMLDLTRSECKRVGVPSNKSQICSINNPINSKQPTYSVSGIPPNIQLGSTAPNKTRGVKQVA